MSKTMALAASTAFTLFVLSAIGLLLFLGPVQSPEALAGSKEIESEAAPTNVQAIPVLPDSSADLAALAEVHSQYEIRLQELDRLEQERQAEYKIRLEELASRSAAVDTQIGEVEQTTRSYLEQSAQLQQALDEYNAAFQAQIQSFEAEKSTRLEQLQTQLAEGQAQLQAAQNQLGQ
jgi:hypothetical protein